MSKKFWAILIAVVVVAVATVAIVTEGQFLKGFLRLAPLNEVNTKPLSSQNSGTKPLSIAKPGLNENITRAQLAVLVVDTLGVKPTQSGCFNDVKSLMAESSICYLTSKDVMQGYNDNTFKPANLVNRAEAAKIFYTAFLNDAGFAALSLQYKDVEPKAWYYNYIQTDSYYKILDIQGGTNANFFPGTSLTVARAQYWIENVKKNVPASYWIK